MSRNHSSNADTPTEEGRYDWTTFDSPLIAVVEAAAEVYETDPMKLPQLQEYVDTDTLETLVCRDDKTPVEVTFQYEELTISIDTTGRLVLKQ